MFYAYCPQCGTSQNPSNRFCPQCGKRFSTTVTPQPPPAPPVTIREEKKESKIRGWLSIITFLEIGMPLMVVGMFIIGTTIVFLIPIGVASIAIELFGDVGYLVGIILYIICGILYYIGISVIGESDWFLNLWGNDD